MQLAGTILQTPGIEGLTILGGEPFDQPEALFELVSHIKANSSLSIMLFSGYTWQQLEEKCPLFKDILLCTDIFIEGPFIKEKRDFTRPWAGSSNQSIHFLTSRYSPGDLQHIPSKKVEIRIPRAGDITINGMLPEEQLWGLYEDFLNIGSNGKK